MKHSEEYQKIVDLIYTWDITNIKLGFELLRNQNYPLEKFVEEHIMDLAENFLWNDLKDEELIKLLRSEWIDLNTK